MVRIRFPPPASLQTPGPSRDEWEIPDRGCQLDLRGVQLNVTTIIADQNHEQHVGIEHIAIETDDYVGALANF